MLEDSATVRSSFPSNNIRGCGLDKSVGTFKQIERAAEQRKKTAVFGAGRVDTGGLGWGCLGSERSITGQHSSKQPPAGPQANMRRQCFAQLNLLGAARSATYSHAHNSRRPAHTAIGSANVCLLLVNEARPYSRVVLNLIMQHRNMRDNLYCVQSSCVSMPMDAQRDIVVANLSVRPSVTLSTFW